MDSHWEFRNAVITSYYWERKIAETEPRKSCSENCKWKIVEMLLWMEKNRILVQSETCLTEQEDRKIEKQRHNGDKWWQQILIRWNGEDKTSTTSCGGTKSIVQNDPVKGSHQRSCLLMHPTAKGTSQALVFLWTTSLGWESSRDSTQTSPLDPLFLWVSLSNVQIHLQVSFSAFRLHFCGGKKPQLSYALLTELPIWLCFKDHFVVKNRTGKVSAKLGIAAALLDGHDPYFSAF